MCYKAGVRRLVSLILVLAALTGLGASLPEVSAADAVQEAYEAYYNYLKYDSEHLGQEIQDKDYYQMIVPDKRSTPAQLKSILGAWLVDLTGDGVEELILKRRVTQVFPDYFGTSEEEKEWITIYTYEKGAIRRIGQNLPWLHQDQEGRWITYDPPGYIGYIPSLADQPYISDDHLYVCRGNDGKVYLADEEPIPYSRDFTFYSYNGSHMEKARSFGFTFHPDWQFGPFQSDYGQYFISIDGKFADLSHEELMERIGKYAGRDCYPLLNNDYTSVLRQLGYPRMFRDVKGDEFFAEPVLWAVRHDPVVTQGVSAGRFGPNSGCTREQVVTFLHRAAGAPRPGIRAGFRDVPAGAFSADAISWAVEHGITQGITSTKFGPGKTCTRGQIVTFLWRACGSPGVQKTNVFRDVPANEFYAEPVAWAVKNGVTQGMTSTKFGPEKTCTRAQIVTFLYRARYMLMDRNGHVHSYTVKEIPPTCTQEGCLEHTCSCGFSYRDAFRPSLGHDFLNGYCTHCGGKGMGRTWKEVYGDDKVTIVFTGYEDRKAHFHITNKTAAHMAIYADALAANGKSTEDIVMATRIDPNAEADAIARLDIPGIQQIGTISGQLQIKDDWGSLFPDYVAAFSNVVVTDYIDAAFRESTDTLLYTDDTVDIYFGSLTKSSNQKEMSARFLVNNKTDYMMTLQFPYNQEELFLDGKQTFGYTMSSDIAPMSAGRATATKTVLWTDDMDLSQVQTISGQLRVYYYDGAGNRQRITAAFDNVKLGVGIQPAP